MNNTFTADTTGERLDQFLARTELDKSRSQWQKICAAGGVSVNSERAEPSRKLTAGDEVQVELPEKPDFSDQTLPVIYEDQDVIVINKPAGVLTHAKGVAVEEFTVAEFLRPRVADVPGSNRPGIVHRLDRDTSGILIAAKNPTAKRWLQKQFAVRKVKKAYLAVVAGHPKQPAALLDLPIERNPKKPQTFRVGQNGKPAETTYETLRSFQDYTLVKLMPKTGRTHQLRVHMAYIGCPIVGDKLYAEGANLGRMFLHATSLEITLPSRERKIFEAQMPDDMDSFVKSLA